MSHKVNGVKPCPSWSLLLFCLLLKMYGEREIQLMHSLPEKQIKGSTQKLMFYVNVCWASQNNVMKNTNQEQFVTPTSLLQCAIMPSCHSARRQHYCCISQVEACIRVYIRVYIPTFFSTIHKMQITQELSESNKANCLPFCQDLMQPQNLCQWTDQMKPTVIWVALCTSCINLIPVGWKPEQPPPKTRSGERIVQADLNSALSKTRCTYIFKQPDSFETKSNPNRRIFHYVKQIKL